MTYPVRSLLTLTPEEILGLPKSLSVVFEDEVTVVTTPRKLLYSKHFWLIHSEYPLLPIMSTHFVEHVLSKDNGVLNSNTHIKLLSVIAEDVVEKYNLHEASLKEHLYGLIYQITNSLYNELNKHTEASVISIDILDFLNLAYDEEVVKTNEVLNPTPENVERAHKKVLSLITNADKNNNIVKAVRAKMVNANQVTQCLSLRGYLSEVDGKILSTPVLSNFTLGLNKLYDLVAESRGAAKSLYFSEAPLETAEYFARRLQLMTMYVEKIEYTDCMSTEYVNWFVKAPEYNSSGEKTYSGDLNYMKGKYYLDASTNALLAIEGGEEHLYNTTIQMRSSLTCRTPNKHHVCHVCFGRLAENINAHANLGHICAATMTRQTSQSVLSNKHYQGSSITTDIALDPIAREYFTIGNNNSALLLNPTLRSKEPKLIISRDSLLGLVDVLGDDNHNDVHPTHISRISELAIEKKGAASIEEIDMVQSSRQCMLSNEFIAYIREGNWVLDAHGNFIFDLARWDYSKDILVYPKKEYSFSEHSEQIAGLIERGISPNLYKTVDEPILYILKELFELVNSKLNVNISLLEVILYAVSTPKEEENLDLSRHYHSKTLGTRNSIIRGRSLSNLYAFEKQSQVISSPASFDSSNRPDSVYDVFLVPGEVIGN